jgi:hypothetical protein
MSSFETRFNAHALTSYVTPNVFVLNKAMHVLLVEWDGPRIVLNVDMGEGTMGLIYVPKPLTQSFTLSDFWPINSGANVYDLYVRQHPHCRDSAIFEIKK